MKCVGLTLLVLVALVALLLGMPLPIATSLSGWGMGAVLLVAGLLSGGVTGACLSLAAPPGQQTDLCNRAIDECLRYGAAFGIGLTIIGSTMLFFESPDTGEPLMSWVLIKFGGISLMFAAGTMVGATVANPPK